MLDLFQVKHLSLSLSFKISICVPKAEAKQCAMCELAIATIHIDPAFLRGNIKTELLWLLQYTGADLCDIQRVDDSNRHIVFSHGVLRLKGFFTDSGHFIQERL